MKVESGCYSQILVSGNRVIQLIVGILLDHFKQPFGALAGRKAADARAGAYFRG